MYSQTYMRQYCLEHKEKIKKQSIEWKKNNPDKVKIIAQTYRENKSICNDIEVLPFEKRVSQELLAKMKENSQVNQKLVKHYEWQEDWIPRKRILEGG